MAYTSTSDSFLKSLNDIKKHVDRCLIKLRAKGIESVSFILIPALKKSKQADELSAKVMISAITPWLNNNDDCISVYLIDHVGGFDELLYN